MKNNGKECDVSNQGFEGSCSRNLKMEYCKTPIIREDFIFA